MISSFDSKNEAASGVFNCTTASTFEKPNSLKFELLFGEYRRKVKKEDGDGGLVNVIDYMFEPGQIFGFAYQSTGLEFKKMHHVFVLRACEPGEMGNIITGVSPGAELLTKTLTHAGSQVFMDMLDKLRNGGVDLSRISAGKYRYINYLLEMKIRCDFFVYKLIANNQNSY